MNNKVYGGGVGTGVGIGVGVVTSVGISVGVGAGISVGVGVDTDVGVDTGDGSDSDAMTVNLVKWLMLAVTVRFIVSTTLGREIHRVPFQYTICSSFSSVPGARVAGS